VGRVAICRSVNSSGNEQRWAERERAELAAFETILAEALAAALLARFHREAEEQASREKAAAEEQAVVVSPTIS